jgi:UDP-2-acetamido-3-amino-2,3-dideoxy-glucuronate N-acetyltransferase
LHQLQLSGRAAGLWLSPDAWVADDVVIRANVVIHAGIRVHSGCRIQDGAILGKQQMLGRHSRAPVTADRVETILEAGASVGWYAVLVAGASIGENAVVGDHALIREHARLEAAAVVGCGCGIGRGVRIGLRSKLMNQGIVAPGSVIEEDVFCGPSMNITNDPTLGRHRGADVIRGALLCRGSRIGACVIMLPGVTIGEEALVGAGSLVTRDVPAWMLAMGSPARVVRDVRKAEFLAS